MARGGWEPKGELAASCDSLVALGMRVVLVRRREMWKLRTSSLHSTIYRTHTTPFVAMAPDVFYKKLWESNEPRKVTQLGQHAEHTDGFLRRTRRYGDSWQQIQIAAQHRKQIG